MMITFYHVTLVTLALVCFSSTLYQHV